MDQVKLRQVLNEHFKYVKGHEKTPIFILHQLDFAESAQINLKIKKKYFYLYLFQRITFLNFGKLWPKYFGLTPVFSAMSC